MKLRTKVVIVSIPILLLNALIVLVATWHEPTLSGTSGEFWEYLCGVRLRSFKGHHPYGRDGGIYPTTDGWLIYWTQMHHEQLVYRLRPAVAAADLPEVLAKLGLADARESVKQVSAECRTWLNENKRATMGADTLVQQLTKTRLATLQRNDRRGQGKATGLLYREGKIVGSALAEAEDFRERWARAQRVWLNYLFESLFLTAWVLFAAWPWFRRATPRRWAVHWALWPLLLFMPYFLGYAPFTFTFGPSGGFVYPLVLDLFSVPCRSRGFQVLRLTRSFFERYRGPCGRLRR